MYLDMYLSNELYKFVASVNVTDADMPSKTSVRFYYLDLLLLSCVIITRTRLCVHTWSVRVQIHLSRCVYAGSFMEFQCFEVKPEDDSKEITECSYDDKPSTGMFSVS